jgi:hypothetical protein
MVENLVVEVGDGLKLKESLGILWEGGYQALGWADEQADCLERSCQRRSTRSVRPDYQHAHRKTSPPREQRLSIKICVALTRS